MCVLGRVITKYLCTRSCYINRTKKGGYDSTTPYLCTRSCYNKEGRLRQHNTVSVQGWDLASQGVVVQSVFSLLSARVLLLSDKTQRADPRTLLRVIHGRRPREATQRSGGSAQAPGGFRLSRMTCSALRRAAAALTLSPSPLTTARVFSHPRFCQILMTKRQTIVMRDLGERRATEIM